MGEYNPNTERERLDNYVNKLSEKKRILLEGLIADASFMAVQLEELRNHIDQNGWTEKYQNGIGQCGIRKTVEADTYLKLQKSYASIIKQLTDAVESKKGNDKDFENDKLLKFLAEGKPTGIYNR